MGQAKRRGTYEQRKQAAIDKKREALAKSDHQNDLAYQRRRAVSAPRIPMLAVALLGLSMGGWPSGEQSKQRSF